MEYKSPRQSDWISDLLSGKDSPPFGRIDCLQFCVLSSRLSGVEAEQIITEALKAVWLVEELVGVFQSFSGCDTASIFSSMPGGLEGWYADCRNLSEALKRPKFGKYLPDLRRRLARKLRYRMNHFFSDSKKTSARSCIAAICSTRFDEVFSDLPASEQQFSLKSGVSYSFSSLCGKMTDIRRTLLKSEK